MLLFWHRRMHNTSTQSYLKDPHKLLLIGPE
jgi:hypothetical protein